MAIIKKISKYGSCGGKCIPLSKDLRGLLDLEKYNYVSIDYKDNKLIIKPITHIDKKEVL